MTKILQIKRIYKSLSNRHIPTRAFIKHGFEEVQLTDCHYNNNKQFSNCEVFYSVLMPHNYLWMNNLSLLLELFIFWNLFQVLAYFDKFSMKFVNLWLFSQLHKMSFIMGVKVQRNWFVFTISGSKTDVCLKVSTDISFVTGSC